MSEPVDLLAALQRSVERARAARAVSRRPCPDCGAIPQPVGDYEPSGLDEFAAHVTEHTITCTWEQDMAEDRATDGRLWP